MKFILLLVLGCLVLDALGTPINPQTKIEKRSDAVATSKAGTARQNDSQNQVNTDDDDDDDDDDEEDLGLDDDDDDDDDEEESSAGTAASDDDDDDEDDDGDYFERFFDDILGDDDDDDDDDEEEESSSSSSQQAVAVSPVAQPAAPPAVEAELQPSENSAGDIPQYDDENPSDETNVVATIDNEAEKEPQVATAAPATAAPAPPPVQPITSENSEDDEDDDDDDDDDLGIDEDDDDDDDDEEEEDDDDDDDDDDDIEDIVDARSVHKPKARAMDPTVSSPRVPPSFITKYNRYVDNILERINKILRTGYDPVNVRLHSVKTSKPPTKKKTTTKKSNKKSNKKNKNKSKKNNAAAAKRERKHLRALSKEQEVNVTISNITVVEEPVTTSVTSISNATTAPTIVSRAKPTKKKPGKTKAAGNTGKPRAKATLYGMATLKRSDDVIVNLMSSHTTIKSKFSIGPLTLKVEKEFGRGAKKELRSATATTTEMFGKINLRLKHGGGATLHSIRVMQPNLLRVDAPDDFDKTREFVWKRSFHIANIVSEKLTQAARSLLEPPPAPPTKNKQKKKKPSNNGGILSYFI